MGYNEGMILTEIQKRATELANRAYMRGCNVFGDFLNPTEQAEVLSLRLPVQPTLVGGYALAERQMLCFFAQEYGDGSAHTPFAIVQIAPASLKYAMPITHRDVLGAVLNLGIERSKMGDILTDGKTAYTFMDEKMATFVVENLQSVGHNTVKCQILDELPVEWNARCEEVEYPVSSLRYDVLIAKVYNLSREQALAYFKGGKVFVDGKQRDDNAGEAKEGQTIAVRGKGKFTFLSSGGVSKKGKIYAKVGVYV